MITTTRNDARANLLSEGGLRTQMVTGTPTKPVGTRDDLERSSLVEVLGKVYQKLFKN